MPYTGPGVCKRLLHEVWKSDSVAAKNSETEINQLTGLPRPRPSLHRDVLSVFSKHYYCCYCWHFKQGSM